ncbi:MAG: hypothetical protein ACRYGF_13765 [Janthinobacterium lividum]
MSDTNTLTSSGKGQISIQPLTTVDATAGTGYFPDPLPVHFAQGVFPTGSNSITFSGSNQTLLTCPDPIQAGHCQTSSIKVDPSAYRAQANLAGFYLPSVGNNNIYQDSSGNWQMATTLHLATDAAGSDPWNVIAHARPKAPGSATGSTVPGDWIVDAILVGSVTQPGTKANYDGKYFEDGGNLYLLFSKALQASPLHDGVVAQLMDSPKAPASSETVTLIEPENDSFGGYNSEYFFPSVSSPFKLVETGNVTKVDGKYAIAYSTGDFQNGNYKAAVAWSDTFLPKAGTTYKKVLLPDPTGVWGGPSGRPEVLYLLQAQKNAWPNDVFDQVQSPGVPAIVQDPGGTWYLFFAGYDPGEVLGSAGLFTPGVRRPYFSKLSVAVPPNATVTATSNTALASWITLLKE